MARNYEINMSEGKLLGKLILFAIPLFLSGLLQLLFNTVDVIVVGQFCDETALAAVGSNGALINLIISLFMGLSVGTNVLCAQGYGANRADDVSDTVHTSIAFSIVSGVVLAVFGFVFAKVFLTWMGSPSDVIDQAADYLKIYFLGMPLVMLYNFAAAVLRAIGDTRRPLYYLIAAGVVNVILNVFFVVVVGIGVSGVALATDISQGLSCFLVVRCLIKEKGIVHLDVKKIRMKGRVLRKMLAIGLPAGIQSTVFSISNVIIQSSINSFGALAIAGNTAASNLESLTGTASNAVYQTNLSFTSQNVGARKYDRVLRITGLCLLMTGTLMFVMGTFFYRFGNICLRLYTDNEEVIRLGLVRLSLNSQFHFLAGLMDCMVGSLRGIGMSLLPMFNSIFFCCVFRLIWIATIFQKSRTLYTLYMSYPITWTLALIAHILCFIYAYRKLMKRERRAEHIVD